MILTGSKIVKTSFALSGSRAILQLLAILKVLLLARILSPVDFGLMGIAATALSTIESVTITGVDLNLVRKRESISEYIDTAWTISIVRGIILALLLFVVSDYIAAFFHSPESLGLLRAIGLVFVLRGFTNSYIVYFTKRLEIKKQIALNAAEILADVIISIIFSLIYRNAWALVFGFLAAAAVRAGASFLLHSERPRLCFDRRKIVELSRFGKFVWGTNVAVFAGNKLDSIVIGKLLEAGSLGLYQMALKLTEPLSKEIGSVMAQVLFPAYSSMQDDHARLQGAYLRTAKITFSIFLPLTLFFVFYSQHVIPLLLGEKWLATIPIVQLLIAAGLFRSLFAIDGWMYYALGKPDYNFIVTVTRLAVLAVTVVPLTYRYGIEGTALSLLIANVFLFVPVVMYGKKLMRINLPGYLKNILAPFAIAVLTIIPTYLLKDLLPWWPWWLAAVSGGAAFLAAFSILERDLCREVLGKLRA